MRVWTGDLKPSSLFIVKSSGVRLKRKVAVGGGCNDNASMIDNGCTWFDHNRRLCMHVWNRVWSKIISKLEVRSLPFIVNTLFFEPAKPKDYGLNYNLVFIFIKYSFVPIWDICTAEYVTIFRELC